MLFKKKEVAKSKISGLPPLPIGGLNQIKSSINKQEDLSTLPELPSMPEFSPIFQPKINSDFKLAMGPEINPEVREEPFTKPEMDAGINIGGFKFPEEKKMTMEIGERMGFQPSFKPSFKFTEQFPTPELRQEAIKIREEGSRISSIDRPIYVKIDKFRDALNTFELVKKKIREIDTLLKRIKETREKEQQELSTWEQEIEEVKERINAVDSKLFSKLD